MAPQDQSSKSNFDGIYEEGFSLIRHMMKGASIPAHMGHSLDNPPAWLDKDRFRRGQAFARKHLPKLLICHMTTIMFNFLWPPVLEVLMYTQKSDSVDKATRRYFETLMHIKAWYEGDLWDPQDPARRSLEEVQRIHRRVGAVSNRNADMVAKCSVSLPEKMQDKCTSWSLIRQDLHSHPDQPSFVAEQKCYFSQMDAVMVLMSSVGPAVCYPEKLGIYGASGQELEDFLHFWRTVGYHLGIKDEFNPCSRGLVEVRMAVEEYVAAIILPGMKSINAQSEYLSRMMVLSFRELLPFNSFHLAAFEPLFLYSCWVLGLSTDGFCKTVTWYHRLTYYFIRFLQGYVMRVPGVTLIMNLFMNLKFSMIAKKIQLDKAGMYYPTN